MLLPLLLLGFLPTPDPTPVGAPAPHLDRTAAVQGWLNASPQAQSFRARWGRWVVRWDERDGSPRALLGEAVPAAQLDAFVADLAALAGLGPGALVPTTSTRQGERQSWSYQLVQHGAPVEGGGLEVHAVNGRVHFALARLNRVRLDPQALADLRWGPPQPGERWLALEGSPGPVFRLVRTHTEGDHQVFTDRLGQEVYRYTLRFHLDVSVEERTVGDALVSAPARGVWVSDTAGSESTDAWGAHTRSPPYDALLDGPALRVWRDGALVAVSGVADEQLDAGTDLSYAAATALHHTHVARDWLEALWPSHPWLPQAVEATVDISTACCNAYYSSGTINFYVGDSTWNNLGRIADVVYHEYGHGVHHYILTGGTFAGDVSEGSADYLAATLLDDPVLAPKARVDGSAIRELDTDRVYPTDLTGEVHNDGLIWGSFLWNLRSQWIDTYGAEAGALRADTLFLTALSLGPTLTDVYEAVLAADDNNGDLSDGTPHACELDALLRQHGLGGEALSAVVLDHTPLGPQPSAATGYTVDFALWDLLEGCGLGTLGAARVLYAVDPPAGAALEELAFEELAPTGGSAGFTAELPRQPAGAQVVYAIEWQSADGSTTVSSHGGLRQGLYTFTVGDREDLWCEGFEAGAPGWSAAPGHPGQSEVPAGWRSQWEVAAPEGQAFSPTAAAEGAMVLGTQVSGDGLYSPNNGQHVRSPALDPSGAHPAMLLLAYQRHLTIEDALYDEARLLRVDEAGQPLETLWSNPRSEAGTAHVLDADWTLHELDLRAQAGAPVLLAWTLQADPGLEFGGWSLDEVCLRTLADPEGHYQASGVQASDADAVVTVSWNAPWVQPLRATALVRNRERVPERVTDGELLDIDFAPTPGEARTLEDPELLPGEIAYYAVFSAWDDTGFLDGATLGTNADAGGVPAPEDTAPPEDTALEEEEDEPGLPEDAPALRSPEARCSCAAGPPSPGLGLGLLLLLAVRRRQAPSQAPREPPHGVTVLLQCRRAHP